MDTHISDYLSLQPRLFNYVKFEINVAWTTKKLLQEIQKSGNPNSLYYFEFQSIIKATKKEVEFVQNLSIPFINQLSNSNAFTRLSKSCTNYTRKYLILQGSLPQGFQNNGGGGEESKHATCFSALIGRQWNSESQRKGGQRHIIAFRNRAAVHWISLNLIKNGSRGVYFVEETKAAQNGLSMNPWRPFSVILLAVFFMLAVGGMLAPSYPGMTADLNFNPAFISWMPVFYALAASVLAPIMGKLGDVFGLKKVLLFGLCVFALGCFMAAFAPAFPMVVAGRFAQGIGMACSMPAGMAFAGRFFPPEKQGQAFAIFSMLCAMGPMIGPTVAGVIIEVLGWRYIFIFGGGATVLVTIAILFIFPKVPVVGQTAAKFDIVGSAVLFVSVGALLLLPTMATLYGWVSVASLVMAAIFIVGVVIFLGIEKKAASPVVNLKLLTSRSFMVPVLMMFFLNVIIQCTIYMMSYYLVTGRGMPSTMTGSWISVMFLVMTISSPIVGKLMEKVQWKMLAFVIPVFMGAGVFVLSRAGADTPFAVLLVASGLIGFGGAFNQPLTMNTSLMSADPAYKGAASGTYRLISDIGSPLGVAIFIPLLSTMGARADGTPNYVAAFPQVNFLLLSVVIIGLILACLYPKFNPLKDNR